MTGPIPFWSFSALKDFETCPYKIYLQRVERHPRPKYDDDPNHPLTRGSRIHREAELFVKGEGPLTKDLVKQKDRLIELAEVYQEGRLEVEQSWWADRNWTPVNYEDPSKWVVVICDAFEHKSETAGGVSDYKSGKSFGNEIKHGEQMQLYAVDSFMRYPQMNVIDVELIYVDESKVKRKTYDRTSVAPLVERWTKRAERLTSCSNFPAKPNKSACRYCPFSPNNGGTGICAYAVEL
jgi:CRISPR/Cas system-associated exonuclease Cas4 (RecB family)